MTVRADDLVEGGSPPPRQSLLDKARAVRSIRPQALLWMLMLTPPACWTRIRAGRRPFAPTFPDRRPTLPRASLAGRVLSGEPFLRPTTECDCHAPEVLAVADELRSRSAGDWQYAQAVFRFAAGEIVHGVEPAPGGVVQTLRRGYGICVDKVNLFVALARAGGLRARYCSITIDVNPDEATDLIENGPPLFRTYARIFEKLEAEPDLRLQRLGRLAKQILHEHAQRMQRQGLQWDLTFHPIAEVEVGETWIPSDPTWDDAEAAAYGLPLPRLGYQPTVLRQLRAKISRRSEIVPFRGGADVGRFLFCLLARGAVDYLNQSLEEARGQGRRVLEEVGAAAYIRRYRHFYVPVPEIARLGVDFPRYPTS
ncbi:MAG: transglutaminase family protein [Candidatus Rokubacteria bacterium]|nr:transglutaminase family protein [Candidatus Rokubacteria bacterium]